MLSNKIKNSKQKQKIKTSKNIKNNSLLLNSIGSNSYNIPKYNNINTMSKSSLEDSIVKQNINSE